MRACHYQDYNKPALEQEAYTSPKSVHKSCFYTNRSRHHPAPLAQAPSRANRQSPCCACLERGVEPTLGTCGRCEMSNRSALQAFKWWMLCLHISSHIRATPVGLGPLLTLLCDLLGERIFPSVSVYITAELSETGYQRCLNGVEWEQATHEGQSIVQVTVVQIDGHIVHPGLSSLGPPFWHDGAFEDETASRQQSLESTAPGVSVTAIEIAMLASMTGATSWILTYTSTMNLCSRASSNVIGNSANSYSSRSSSQVPSSCSHSAQIHNISMRVRQ